MLLHQGKLSRAPSSLSTHSNAPTNRKSAAAFDDLDFDDFGCTQSEAATPTNDLGDDLFLTESSVLLESQGSDSASSAETGYVIENIDNDVIT